MPKDTRYPPVAVILGSREDQCLPYGTEKSVAVQALQKLTDVLIVRIAEVKDPLPDRVLGKIAALFGREYTTLYTVLSATKASARTRSQVSELPGVAALISLAPPTEAMRASHKIPVIQVTDSSFFAALLRSERPGARVSRLVSVQGKLLDRLVTSGSALFAATTAWVRDTLVEDLHVPAERVEVVPLGSFITDPIIRPARTTNRDLLKILFVSENWQHDGGQLVLEMYEKLVEERKVKLCVAGDAPEDLLFEIDRVSAGDTADLAAVFAEHDVLLVPVTAGKDALILNALTCGLPVMGQLVEGVSSLVRHERSGWLYEPEVFAAQAVEKLRFLKAVDIDAASDVALGDSRERLNWDEWARHMMRLVLRLNGR